MTWDCPVKDCPGDLEMETFEDGFTQHCWECDFFSHGPPYANEIIEDEKKCPKCDTNLKDMHCSNCNVTYEIE